LIVVDASVLAPALGDDGPAGQRARERLRDEDLAAPELIDLEVVAVLRRAARARHLQPARAAEAMKNLVALPMARVSHRFLIERIWELRENLTSYDASYIALAELLDTPLVTADRGLAQAPGARCEVSLLA